ncbi:inorganic pyrophosphatase [Candidatus Parcubacteria bacterium]|nr:MAG: inorganic pyrophosphatase [Candidatus Parcubacteria bacterium]
MADYATKLIGQKVTVMMDRKMGSVHPRFKEIYYCQNYGYVPETKAPDGDEIDAYVLGVFKPFHKYIGKAIAVVRREDDDDDKLIVVPDGVDYSDEQILALVEFQERFFKASVIRKD